MDMTHRLTDAEFAGTGLLPKHGGRDATGQPLGLLNWMIDNVERHTPNRRVRIGCHMGNWLATIWQSESKLDRIPVVENVVRINNPAASWADRLTLFTE